MRYDKNTGPLDVTDRVIEVGDFIVVGSNNGLTPGTVTKISTHEYIDYQGSVYGYGYSITVDKKYPSTTRRQTFSHEVQGARKFWKVESD